MSPRIDAEMRDYFTAARTKKLLGECEAAGINAWQSRADHHIMRLLNEYRLEGGGIQWVAQTASEYADLRRNLSEIMTMKPVAIYHHGSITDRLWLQGKTGELEDRLKLLRQTGVPAGLGTHIPEVVDYAESKGWDVDFYMTCVYRIVEGDTFMDSDREKMLARVRAVSKPCLIFKVYGASRNCGSRESKLAALRLAFRYAKAGDALVIGMYPKDREQVRENCRLVKEAIGQARP